MIEPWQNQEATEQFKRRVTLATGPEEVLNIAWWFIENVSDDTPGHNTMFFALREKIRNTLRKNERGA